ncbi:hypothetical protein OUZ56_023017 [Daphnia magna]|uniref:Uncharacterized protein n=1 Tax=Daphnia magna TaxID=35525 RepID=A0ABR0AYE2_9CRUS|nr:hypothetical protein OUZ56_023017 [Daphnia magna]
MQEEPVKYGQEKQGPLERNNLRQENITRQTCSSTCSSRAGRWRGPTGVYKEKRWRLDLQVARGFAQEKEKKKKRENKERERERS